MPPEYRSKEFFGQVANEQLTRPKREIKFVLFGLLNLLVGIPLGIFGLFGLAFSGGDPYATTMQVYTLVAILLGLPLCFLLSSLFLFSHYFRRTSGDSVVMFVYIIIPWALFALLCSTWIFA